MKTRRCTRIAAVLSWGLSAAPAWSGEPGIPRFDVPPSPLELTRPVQVGAFFDVAGRRAAAFGYEDRGLEVWTYPLKLVEDFRLSFLLEGYPLEFAGPEIAATVAVRPESTTFTYSHAGFTVRQTLFAPVHEPGVVMLLDVDSVLPLTVVGRFRPRLKLMWPAGLMTGDVSWDEGTQTYTITEESRRFAAVVGAPGARDVSVMPYQEEPRDVPLEFRLAVPPGGSARRFLPVVMAGSVFGRDDAKRAYDRLLANAESLYRANVDYYRDLEAATLRVDTPDDRLDAAFAWAKVGVDKGLVANPLLGTGLVAGFRTSGESERPGFAWLFGRDALWTAFAIHSYGDFAAARSALEFLASHQRDDGKVPHEISQSAGVIPWFRDYPYPWNSADATPLFVIAHADHWRATGDRAFLDRSWEAIVRAWRFTARTDTDGNGLVENGTFGHGWVEGGDLYPAHEEIYQQGVWLEACGAVAELAESKGDAGLAEEARERERRGREAVERTYWLPDRGFYAFATRRPMLGHPEAEKGPRRAERQARLHGIAGSFLVDEDTVLPAVPMWWRLLDPERAQAEVDRLGRGALATDWGARLLAADSVLYDPLSYHHGSVWPLFTGWASMAAYGYGRPHVGYQALMATALLTFQGALGYVTELLSGDFNAAFSRSSHHQIWTEAMVVTPLVRGLLGLQAVDGGRVLRVAPQLPATWDHVAMANVPAGPAPVQLRIERAPGRMALTATRAADAPALRLDFAPALALDARVLSVTVNGTETPFQTTALGDVQRVAFSVAAGASTEAIVSYEAGTEVFAAIDPAAPGATSGGLRVLRVRPDAAALRLVLEGIAGRTYPLAVRTPRFLEAVDGITVRPIPGGAELSVSFEGPAGTYVRRELALPLR